MHETERLLSSYRFWGLSAVGFFGLFLMSMLTVALSTGLNRFMVVMPLFPGFLWIGTTSLSRHSLVRLKQYMGKEVGLFEFVSTQFVFILFPYTYRELKKEVSSHAGQRR
jgi:hypothetical protein